MNNVYFVINMENRHRAVVESLRGIVFDVNTVSERIYGGSDYARNPDVIRAALLKDVIMAIKERREANIIVDFGHTTHEFRVNFIRNLRKNAPKVRLIGLDFGGAKTNEGWDSLWPYLGRVK